MPPKLENNESASMDVPKKQHKSLHKDLVWTNVLIFIVLHIAALIGLLLSFTVSWKAWVLGVITSYCSGLGVTAGAHRLWCHRTYKAAFPLRILLMVFNCIACQNDLYEWSRDHRVHHKFSETDADPHNINRGFFFAHMGWLMHKKHPEVREKGRTIDCSDLLQDPVVRFQKRFYIPLVILLSFYLPTMIPVWYWGERVWVAFLTNGILRYVVTLHFTWLVNSAAHCWGNQPYNRFMEARENKHVAWWALGEGFHNYHHTFPYDYSTSEYGWKLNISTVFIDSMAVLGQAYDRKTVDPDVIRKTKLKTGDGTETFQL
ncbi:acyl-CoA desaturase 4-like [Limulus polyphemus]|uniref:Acyl-CoA desaturase 4-like n=1 Tax=Limulus polyphemus TaxID=6850 RepID=A0ABM1BHV2_LIMPO|nr:acyl-CoA desaturase 4-like [Limulus polyphemus]